MEDENQELKFVCNLCDKRYPCGKSLGGHVRSHVVVNSAGCDEKADPKIGSLLLKEPKIEESMNGQSSYLLRENPRKTWRAVGSTFKLQQERVCKQCGKGFQSLKGLCDMACHSDRGREAKGSDQIIRTTSFKSSKYKWVGTKCSSFSLGNNGSSSVSEIDVDEQELAMCLVMLSRDSIFRGGFNFNSVVESPDSNSVTFESKSSSIEMKTRKMDTPLKNIKDSKLKKWESETAQTDGSDSGYFFDESVEVDSDLSINRKRKSSAFVEFNKVLLRSREVSQKRSKYECFNCNKVFKSYQALGGHRPCHKRSNEYYGSSENSPHDSTEHIFDRKPSGRTSLYETKNKAKKTKGHVCPFCNRVFKNGQALGGHKRSHFIGGHRKNHVRIRGIKPDLLDLNLPAPEKVEEDRDIRFSSW